MESIRNLTTRLVREEEGAAAAEYAILVAFIAAAVAAAVAMFDLNGIFETVSNKVKDAVENAGGAPSGG